MALTEALVLVSPDFTKDFKNFCFASEDTLVVVLLQKNKDGLEQPLAFFSKNLRDLELKYNTLEKQDYSLVKELKFSEFMFYIPRLFLMFLMLPLRMC